MLKPITFFRKTSATHPSAENLVDGRRLLQRTLGHDLGPHFLHVQHESVERFLYMRLLVLFLAVVGLGWLVVRTVAAFL